MRLAVVSPHLDDAALSVGATIASRASAGDDIVIVTACSVVNDVRRARADVDAVARLGARALHLGLDDAPLRGRTPTWAGLVDSPDDDELRRAAGRALADIVASVDEVWAPLAVGGHIDHRATREAVLDNVSDRAKARVALYEDRPYARAAGAVAAAWARAGAADTFGADGVFDQLDHRRDDDDEIDDEVAFLCAVAAPRSPARRPPRAPLWRGRVWRRASLSVDDVARAARATALHAYRALEPALFDDEPTRWPSADRAEHLWRPT